MRDSYDSCCRKECVGVLDRGICALTISTSCFDPSFDSVLFAFCHKHTRVSTATFACSSFDALVSS